MAKKAVRIGIVAASSPYSQEIATRVERLAAGLFPENPPELPEQVTPREVAAWTIASRVLLNLDEAITKN